MLISILTVLSISLWAEDSDPAKETDPQILSISQDNPMQDLDQACSANGDAQCETCKNKAKHEHPPMNSSRKNFQLHLKEIFNSLNNLTDEKMDEIFGKINLQINDNKVSIMDQEGNETVIDIKEMLNNLRSSNKNHFRRQVDGDASPQDQTKVGRNHQFFSPRGKFADDQPFDNLLQKLELTAAQQKKKDSFYLQKENDTKKEIQKLKQYQQNRQAALNNENFSQLKKATAQVYKSYANFANIKLTFRENIHKILTPEQKEQLKNMSRQELHNCQLHKKNQESCGAIQCENE